MVYIERMICEGCNSGEMIFTGKSSTTEFGRSSSTNATSAERLVSIPAGIRQNVKGTMPKMMTPIETYKMALATMTHEELIEYTAILLRSLDKLGIEVGNDDSGNPETGE